MVETWGAINENSNIPVIVKDADFVVTSAGYHKMLTRVATQMYRAHGRPDYQMLFVVHGSAFYTVNGVEHLVRQGGIVLYRPDELQKYIYRADLQSEVYWVHFSGRDPEKLLHHFGLDAENPQYAATQPEYIKILDGMIEELQLKRPNFKELVTLRFFELLALISRQTVRQNETQLSPEIEGAIRMFHNCFAQNISLSDYARQCNMSLCWFTRQFRRQTGKSPQAYLMEIRINRAKGLLDSMTGSISQIADILGYQSPLYFSRVFKKHTGLSPTEYRALCRERQGEEIK